MNEDDGYRDFNLYIILMCGIIIMMVGVYINHIAPGLSVISYPYKMQHQQAVVSGPYVIALGTLICIFPVYQLMKKKFKIKN